MVFIVLAWIVASSPIQAQDVVPTVSLENAYDFGYNLATNSIGSAFRFTIGIGLTDKLQGGFSFVNGDGVSFQNYRLLGLSYSFLPRLGVTLSIGSQTSGAGSPFPVVGVGVYSTLFGKSVQGSLQTGLRLLIDYLAPAGIGIASGTIRVGLSAMVGM